MCVCYDVDVMQQVIVPNDKLRRCLPYRAVSFTVLSGAADGKAFPSKNKSTTSGWATKKFIEKAQNWSTKPYNSQPNNKQLINVLAFTICPFWYRSFWPILQNLNFHCPFNSLIQFASIFIVSMLDKWFDLIFRWVRLDWHRINRTISIIFRIKIRMQLKKDTSEGDSRY